ncbi:MAG: DNA polymerase III subunit delta [Thermodesulfobacteriota bacterium]|nr:DNA polymerase III subunit delta [Thermodesulfobacteriota bacterium]
MFCPDPELTLREVGGLAQRFDQGSSWERHTYFGPIDKTDEDLSPAFWEDIGVSSLLGTKKMLVVRRAHKLPVDFWNGLTSALAGFNANVWPVFCLEGEWDKKGSKPPKTLAKQKYWAVAEKKGWVRRIPGLSLRTLPGFIKKIIAEQGLTISPGALRILSRSLPWDAGAAVREMEKLVLWMGERTEIRESDLGIISPHADMDVFVFLRGLIQGTAPEKVWQKVFADRLVGAGDKIFFGFLGLLQREIRTLWQLGRGEKPSVYVPFAVQGEKKALARKLGEGGSARIWDLALEAEYGIKTGSRSVEQAFEALVAGLHTVFRDTKPQRPGKPAF